MRRLAGAAILSIQLLAIVYARFVPTRYLCWAPYDEITLYEIEVELAGRRLTQEEIRGRYHIRSSGRDNRSWAHITEMVDQYERTYGLSDDADVRMRYTVNGRGPFVWRWPAQHPHEPGTESAGNEPSS
jgi:hypothetical protein